MMRSQPSFAPGMILFALVVLLGFASEIKAQRATPGSVLKAVEFQHYFTQFTNDEIAILGQDEPPDWEWFTHNIPLLDVPDPDIEEIYYFRWYSFRKHIKPTPGGFVIDEFLDDVPWAGKFNTISCAAGHHIREARWLRNSRYVEDYAKFWFGPDGEPRRYSFWAADSVYQLFLATGNRQFAIDLLPALRKNYAAWEDTHRDPNGLFWQIDDRDGMEFSIGGSGYRPTISSYMYGDAKAIAQLARLAGETKIADEFEAKATVLRQLIESRLWNPKDEFYETVPRKSEQGWSGVREEVGFVPWYFDIPSPARAEAWKQLFDPQGFAGAFGPTTAERRNPRFKFTHPHECLWNGPSWPFATTQTLVALANLLNGQSESVMTRNDYFRLLSQYTNSQHIRTPNGKVAPWIDEDLDADTGEWLARDILKSKNQPPPNRGRYYNHSGYADLIITGLIGVRPSSGDKLEIHPLVPAGRWDYFGLDALPYHGHLLTILYDRKGSRYDRGAGLTVLCDGRVVGHGESLNPITVVIPREGGRLATIASSTR